MYCSHCGSDHVQVLEGNEGMEMFVAEEGAGCIECYDDKIEMLLCLNCNGITYRSLPIP